MDPRLYALGGIAFSCLTTFACTLVMNFLDIRVEAAHLIDRFRHIVVLRREGDLRPRRGNADVHRLP